MSRLPTRIQPFRVSQGRQRWRQRTSKPPWLSLDRHRLALLASKDASKQNEISSSSEPVLGRDHPNRDPLRCATPEQIASMMDQGPYHPDHLH
jgi:hypothetical protein